jgi:UDP-N-acetylglucosamine 1-carboxyvinyltransferase
MHFEVHPTGPLQGEVSIGGAKNSALKLMAATTLCPGRFELHNVPRISDVEWMGHVLEAVGASLSWETDGATAKDVLVIDAPSLPSPETPYELVERMRASTALLGPLLARCGEARIALPGGDDFGSRPINMHIDALAQMGAEFELSHGTIEGRCAQLTGARISLEYPSVGATESVLLAAVVAEGETTIQNAAREPEIVDLAAFLNRMGAQVVGAGSSAIKVSGVNELRPVSHRVMADRIEAATFIAAVAAAGGEVTLHGAVADDLNAVIRKFGAMGMRIASSGDDSIWVSMTGRLQRTDVATLPYPGVPTDVLPLMVACLATADGTSFATENLFSGRFRYVGELARLGATITLDGHHLVIDGVERLSGAPVRASDIRAGAALVVAALSAEGVTTIHDATHIDRGYQDLDGRLSALGADIRRVNHPAGTGSF